MKDKKKVVFTLIDENEIKKIKYDCPGCGRVHIIPVSGTNCWVWNGSLENCTLNPSVLTKTARDGEDKNIRNQCHHFVVNGEIAFLSDCDFINKG